MPNNLTNMSKVKQILQHYTEGVSKSMISKKTGVSRNTVKRFIRQFIAMDKSLEEILAMSDRDLELMFKALPTHEQYPRYKDLIGFFPYVDKELKKKGKTRLMMWKEYLKRHPDGFKHTQFNQYYRQWSKRSNATMHIDHKAGDKMYVDYAGETLQIVDSQTGELQKVQVFVSILGASQLTYVEATMSQCKEDFITSCENALHYYGGAPQAIVTDNLKSAVIKSDKYEPTLNEAFRDFVEHYRMVAMPAGPYKPRHKALVEGAVKIIYRVIYAIIRERAFNSLEALNKAIWELLLIHNSNPLNGRSYSRRQMFEEVERSTLQPLVPYRYELKWKRVATVSKTNYVCLNEDKHYYSVPYYYIGKRVTVLYSQSQVDIYYRYDHIASHKRNRRPYMFTTVIDHLASNHKYASDWNPEKFIERATVIGEETRKYIMRILNLRPYPEQAYKTCQGILNYASRVGNQRLNAACMRANFYEDYSYKTIVAILDKGLDQVPLETEDNLHSMPVHGNIRGNDYYA
jgi:transposase